MNNKNFPEIEKELIEKWKNDKIFEKTKEEKGKKFYSFFDGPPFATGLPHYGHLLASTAKDVFARFRTQKGYFVPRRWGWDCHGLPIENIIESDLNVSGKKEIEEKGIGVFNQACESAVLKYSSEWWKTIERIGRWVDFENAYKTMDPTYMESVWWATKQIWEKDLIYKGRKILLYCPRCETPISNFEVAMDSSYQNIEDETVFVKIKLKKSDKFPDPTYVLIWTTTPWTLPANAALAVGEDIDYNLVKVGGENLILAKAQNKVLDKDFEHIRTFKGSELTDQEYEPLFEVDFKDEEYENVYKIFAGDFVTTEDGTGIVHIAPGYGEDDYNLGRTQKLPTLTLLDEKGKFTKSAPEFLQNDYFLDANEKIISDLKDRELLFKTKMVSHQYPFCWRCNTQLYYSAIPAWFINIQKIKDRLVELNENINWYPAHLKHGRFENGIKDAPDWNISRNRYFATALPIWECENKDCDERECIGSYEELKEKAINFDEVYDSPDLYQNNYHKPKIDDIKLKCSKCDSEMKRISEVMDCWLESAAMPFAEIHYPFENEEKFKKRYPAQFVSEYISQTRAWFYVMHVMGAVLFDREPFENVLTTGTILNEKGEKLSKSKKNFPDPSGIIEKYGADALRFYLMSSVVMKSENLLFKELDVQEVYRKVILMLQNILSFYKLYEGAEGDFDREKVENILDKWILSRLEDLKVKTTNSMEKYNTVLTCRNLQRFIDDLSVWYLRRSRDRFKEGDPQGIATFKHVLVELSKILAPITPFIADYIYSEVGGPKESVHLDSWPSSSEEDIDKDLLDQMQKVRSISALALAARAEKGIKNRQPLGELLINVDLPENLLDLVKNEVNVKEVKYSKDLKEFGEKENWVVKNDQTLYIGLNFEITDELQKEGVLRELLRQINDLRKKQGLTIKDQVKIEYKTEDSDLQDLIEKNKEIIQKNTISDSIKEASGEIENKISVDGKDLYIELRK